jgi:DNA repair exonuclease SbcCD ATPase subunit
MGMIIRLRNFGIYEDTGVIDIPNGLSLILGKFVENEDRSNGSGKSSLIEGITFGCWGEARTTNEFPSGDGLIRRPPQGKKMEIDLDIDGIVINRNRKYNSSSNLVVTHRGKVITGNHSNTQKQLEAILGISYDIFSHTFYIPVHGTGLFTQLKPTEAKRKIIDMLALSRWDDRKKAVSADIAELRNTIANINTQIQVYTDALPGNLDELVDIRYQHARDKLKLESELLDLESNNKKFTNELSDIGVRLSDIQREIDKDKESRNNINRLKRRLEDLDSRIQDKDNQLIKVKEGIDVIRERILSIDNIISNLESKKYELYETINSDSDRYEEMIVKKNDYSDKIVSSMYMCNDTIKECEKISEIIKNLENRGIITCPITSNACPVLSNPDVVAGQLAEHKLMLKGMSIKLAEVNKQHKEIVNASALIDKEISNIERIRNDHNIIVADIFAHNKQKESFNRELLLAESMIGSHDLDKVKLINDYNEIKEELAKVSASSVLSTNIMFEYNTLSKHRDGILIEIDGINVDIKNINEKIVSISNEVAVIDASIKRYHDMKSKIEELDDELNKRNITLSDLSILSNAFGMDGIPTYIIDSASSEIESVANDILEMGDQSVRISIILKEETKTKDSINGGFKVKDTFKINLIDSNTGDEFSYDSNSAGEKMWVDFSIRMALAMCVRARTNMGIDMFLIDEGLQNLDSIARYKFINILRDIMNRYKIKYVWLITHVGIQQAMTLFDNMIVCNRNGNKTQIEVI